MKEYTFEDEVRELEGRSKPKKWLVVIILSVYTLLVAWIAYRYSPTWDEVAHLPAGLSHWEQGKFELYAVNPPLVRSIAAFPILFLPHKTDWTNLKHEPRYRSEFQVGKDFVAANGSHAFILYTVARWICIPFGILGAWICYRWGKELYGEHAGILALILWCFSPLVLTFSAIFTPDVAAAALGVTTCYRFWHWLKSPTWWNAFFCGIILGIAELTKCTLVVFYGLLPMMWLAWCFVDNPQRTLTSLRSGLLQLSCIFFLSVYIINLGYGFEGTFDRLGTLEFVSESGKGYPQEKGSWMGNRFKGTWMENIPIPLPKNYVIGIDVQKREFETPGSSYLRGEWKDGGWYHYYIYGLLVKEPIGEWIIVLLGIIFFFISKRYRSELKNELTILIPLLFIFIFLSMQTGFNRHIRYCLPVFPFAFIWISKVAKSIEFRQWGIVFIIALSMFWSLGSTFYYYPHCMSYFNEFAGGPLNGHRHLGNSNVDWGQSMKFLREWMDKHPEARFDSVGFEGIVPHKLLIRTPHDAALPPNVPTPGWHAIGINWIHTRGGAFEYFLDLEPYDIVGYTVYIYHVSEEDANRLRRKNGQPKWDPELKL